MNISISQDTKTKGFLMGVFGPMFAGKSSTAMRQGKIFQSIGWKVLCIRYKEDTRYDQTKMMTHDGMSMEAITEVDLLKVHQLYANAETDCMPYDCIIIDEIQLFNEVTTVHICRLWREKGVFVICTGLDLDADRLWWPISQNLFRFKDDALFLKAYCMHCKEAPAPFTWRLCAGSEKKDIGGADKYMAVCGHCYDELLKERQRSSLSVSLEIESKLNTGC